ncbi:MAG TPA: hypothetical protein VGX46_13235 [Vicinamibacterales bacterium]|nr:hypothetical protein [Vicinamibacterales bacterium]
MFGNDARQKCWRDKQHKSARRGIQINDHVDAGWDGVERACVTPAFADATAQDVAQAMRAGDVQCHDVIGERGLQVLRRVNPLQGERVPSHRDIRWSREQADELGCRDRWTHESPSHTPAESRYSITSRARLLARLLATLTGRIGVA